MQPCEFLRDRMCLARTAIVIVGLMAAGMAAAAVEKLPIPGGEIRDFAFTSATRVFAATQGGGIYLSESGGSSWIRLENSPARYVHQFALGADNRTLYAATDEGVFVTLDDGVSWRRLFDDETVAIAARPGSSDSVLFGVRGAGVYRIEGGGAPERVSAGIAHLGISAVAFDPVNPDVVYAGSHAPCPDGACVAPPGVGVYRSENGGLSWTDISGNISLRFITGLAVSADRTVFASTRSPAGCGAGGVDYLAFGSSTWANPAGEVAGGVFGAETVVLDRQHANAVWVGSCGLGLYRGVKVGSAWSFSRQHAVGSPPAELLNAAFAIGSSPFSPRVVAGVRGAGAFYSNSPRNGATTVWHESSGMHALRATALAAPDTAAPTLVVGTRGAGVLVSGNGGVSWARSNSGFPTLSGTTVPTLANIRGLSVDPSSPSSIAAIAGGFGGYPGGVFFRGGLNWGRPGGGGTLLNPIGLAHVGLGGGIAVSNFDDQFQAGLFTATASVGAFSRRDWRTGFGRIHRSIFVPGRLFALSYASDTGPSGNVRAGIGMFSSDYGSSWRWMTATHTGFMQLGAYAIAERDRNNLVAATNKGLFASSDGGLSWTRVAIQQAVDSHVFSGVAYVGETLFAVSRSGGFYCSTNHGRSWLDRSGDLPANERPVFVDLVRHADDLYLIADGAGVFKARAVCAERS